MPGGRCAFFAALVSFLCLREPWGVMTATQEGLLVAPLYQRMKYGTPQEMRITSYDGVHVGRDLGYPCRLTRWCALRGGGGGRTAGKGASLFIPPQGARGRAAMEQPLGPISRGSGGEVRRQDQGEGDGEEQKFAESFLDFESRVSFIRKVYLTLFVQLLCTTGICAGLRPFQSQILSAVNRSRWTMGAFFILSIVGTIVPPVYLAKNKEVRQNFPQNLPMLLLFTISWALYAGYFSLLFEGDSVVAAGFQTLAVVGALTVYAFRTNPKHELTALGSSLFAGLNALSFVILLKLLFFRNAPVLDILLPSGCALLFSLYIVYDTYQIIGGKHRNRDQLSTKDWALGAMALYTDMIQIFLHLLSIFGEAMSN